MPYYTVSDENESARLGVLKSVKEGAPDAVLVPKSRIRVRVEVSIIFDRSPHCERCRVASGSIDGGGAMKRESPCDSGIRVRDK